MKITANEVKARGIKFTLIENELEVARAYLYLMHNDLHLEPFGLLEDVYVIENKRGEGLGTELVNRVIETAKKQGCYKLIATSRKSRPKVHQLYKRLSFEEHGLEFRINL